jgi:hypothetical protein
MQQQEQFDVWAVLELMGRQRIAGKVTERVIAGTGFLHVLVPATSRNPEFSRLISPSSIYAINPVTEEVARASAERINEQPIQAWDVREHIAKMNTPANSLLASAQESLEEQREEWEEEESDPYRD